MADSLIYPELFYFQWATPDDPNPRLARSCSAAATTLYCTVIPYDADGNLITGKFLMGVKNQAGYVETVYVPAGAGSIEGTTYKMTGVVRGIALEGIDFDTGNPDLAVSHQQDDPVFCNISGVIQALVAEKLVFPIFADTTERDAQIPSPVNGKSRCYVTALGLYQLYAAGSWQSVDTGTVTPNMSTTVAGKGQISTVADAKAGTPTGVTGAANVITADVLQDSGVSTTTSAGVADAGKLVKLDAAGLISGSMTKAPIVQVYTQTNQTFGSSTTRFDITNPSGTTFRYTYDGTGTDPTINSTNFPIGTKISIVSSNMNDANNVNNAVITNVGTNFFEITNASGVAENDKTLGTNGYLTYASRAYATWTKPAGLSYVIVEVQGGGGAGLSQVDGNQNATPGGGGGGYAKKLIAASALGATETVTLGYGGIAVPSSGSIGGSAAPNGGLSDFSTLTAEGGASPTVLSGTIGAALGGTATGGDINVPGQPGQNSAATTSVNGANGGGSMLGTGGLGGTVVDTQGGNGLGYGGGGGGVRSDGTPTALGGNGAPGVVIVTEYY